MVDLRFQVLHPGLKLEYFRKHGWEPEWIDNAKAITWDALADYKGLDSTEEDPDATLVDEVHCPILDKNSSAHGFVDRSMMMILVIFVSVLRQQCIPRN